MRNKNLFGFSINRSIQMLVHYPYRRVFLFFVVLVFSIDNIGAQVVNEVPLSERITGYKMDVTLDTENRTVSGQMEAFWVNNTDEIVPDIRLHLYMNAFKSGQTTVYKEMGQRPNPKRINRGWIDINSFKDDQGNDFLPLMEYISPDDGNPNDSTVVRVLLPKPALPGDTVKIFVGFETKLPILTRRTGFSQDFYFVGQWFPKFGVYEPKGMRYSQGAWNCHQFHANSEFYSDHSVYEVNITLPKEYIVGSGGILLSESDNGATKQQSWRAEDIVDFAWTAWPGYKEFTDTWNHVDIRLLLPESRIDQVDRQMAAVKNALEFFTDNLGPYPWTYVTVVDPPTLAAGASGMEYTTLFTSESVDNMPDFIRMPEMVTVHEFGHAFFMGILATNEFEEPWMDEGMNTFFENRIMDGSWGENSGLVDHPLFKMADKTTGRMSYVNSPNRQFATNDLYSWEYPNGTYSMMSYMKSATWLYSLMGVVGEETTNDIFREYYRKWAFKHPCANDFVDVVNEVVTKKHGVDFGENMDWFFEQTLYGTEVCDYEVTEISGSTAYVARTGDMVIPVEVLVHFEDGAEILEKWSGKERFKSFVYPESNEIKWVKIDPELKNRMDINFTNNSRTVDKNSTPINRITNKLMTTLQLMLLQF